MKNSILLILKSHLVNRKKQSIVTGLSIATCTLILCVGIAIVLGMQSPYDRMFDQQQASHILLHFDKKMDDPTAISRWFANQEAVAKVSDFSAHHTFPKKCIHKGKEMEVLLILTEHNQSHLHQDQLRIVEGTANVHPEFGKVWLPIHFKKSHGIELGDTIVLPLKQGSYDLVVSAFIIDPHYISGLMNPTRVWIAEGGLAMFLTAQDITYGSIGVRLHKHENPQKIWSEFSKVFEYNGSHFTFELFKNIFLSFYNLIGVVLLIFAVLGIALTLLLLTNNLRNILLGDYKELGIYKAIGLSTKQIRRTYVVQFGILAFLGIITGLGFAVVVLSTFSNLLSNSLGKVDTNLAISIPAFISSISIFVLVLLSTLWQIRKIKNVVPQVAIRVGRPAPNISSNNSRDHKMLHHLPNSVFLALKMIVSDKKRFVFSMLSLTGIVALLCFCINVSNSFTKLEDNKTYWGFEAAEVLLSPGSRLLVQMSETQFTKQLEKEPGVKSVSPFAYHNMTIINSKNQLAEEIYGKVYSQNIDALGLQLLAGRNPTVENEVALCINTARTQGASVGDTIIAAIDGLTLKLKVVGIYQDISNMGKGFRLSGATMKHINPMFKAQIYGLRLNEGIDKATFAAALQRKFGESLKIEKGSEQRQEVKAVINGVKTAFATISCFFLIIMGIIIYNDQLLELRENDKSFHIFKAIGFSNRQIRISLYWKMLFNIIASSLIGIPLAVLLSPVLMNAFTGSIGLTQFPYWPSFTKTLLLIPTLLIISIVLVRCSTNALKRIQASLLVG